jgi:hypothetical protein
MLPLALALLLVGPAKTIGNAPADDEQVIARISGFSNIVINHVNRTIGSESLPSANGIAVEPGVFVTLGMEGLQVYDHDVIVLQGGQVTDRTASPQCVSGCPAALYDAFALEWLRMSVEGATLALEVPTRVHIAADARVPVSTFLDAAYAASESRPVLPPVVTILVNSVGRGLRSQPVFLLPPDGLVLPQGSAALGFTVKFGANGYTVDAADATLGRDRKLASPKMLAGIIKTLRKRHPSKEAVILEPDDSVSMGQLMALIAAIREDFPRIILSRGQEVVM